MLRKPLAVPWRSTSVRRGPMKGPDDSGHGFAASLPAAVRVMRPPPIPVSAPPAPESSAWTNHRCRPGRRSPYSRTRLPPRNTGRLFTADGGPE